MVSKNPVKPPYAPLRHPAALSEGQKITLDAGMLRSIRFRELNESEAFTLMDSTGACFRASLLQINESNGRAVVYEKMRLGTESPVAITLVCAVLSRQRMLLVCQKATELGVQRIVPVWSEYAVPRSELEFEKPWAWAGQCLKAVRQCRRASVPELTDILSLHELTKLGYWLDADLRIALDDRADSTAPLDAADGKAPQAAGDRAVSELVLAVGPEGGWSDTERKILSKSGATMMTLGGRVLRAETAVWTGLTVLQHRWGDLQLR
jgi:16S rRNA (uracil1498-N3)-methyltransferase